MLWNDCIFRLRQIMILQLYVLYSLLVSYLKSVHSHFALRNEYIISFWKNINPNSICNSDKKCTGPKESETGEKGHTKHAKLLLHLCRRGKLMGQWLFYQVILRYRSMDIRLIPWKNNLNLRIIFMFHQLILLLLQNWMHGSLILTTNFIAVT